LMSSPPSAVRLADTDVVLDEVRRHL